MKRHTCDFCGHVIVTETNAGHSLGCGRASPEVDPDAAPETPPVAVPRAPALTPTPSEK